MVMTAKLHVNQYEAFCANLEELVEGFKTPLVDQISEQIKKANRDKSIPTCNEEARAMIEPKWTSLDNKISLVSGFDLLSSVNSWIREEFGESCSQAKILKNMKAEDIDDEVKKVISQLVT